MIKVNIPTYSDYYPFGMEIESLSANSSDYRYSFGGHEKDDEVKGSGNHLGFGNFGYDTRLGRRFQIDPIEIIGISGYAVFNNNPLVYKDPDGESPISIFIKAIAKAGLKKAAKEFVEAQIKKQLAKYIGKKGARKWAVQLADDAMTFVDYATATNWYDYVLEVIPVVGDAYGASKLGKQGYTLWKGLEKFKNVGRLTSQMAKSSWKALGSNNKLTGKGAEALRGWITNINGKMGRKLNDNTNAGAIKEVFGLKSGFKADGTPFNHLTCYIPRIPQ